MKARCSNKPRVDKFDRRMEVMKDECRMQIVKVKARRWNKPPVNKFNRTRPLWLIPPTLFTTA